jgi:hypothetical protein
MNVRLSAVVAAIVCVGLTVAGCGKKSPTAPSGPTRIINVTGDLNFGDVPVGSSVGRSMTISNSGTATLTVTQITVPSFGFTATWINGTIAPGASQPVTVFLTPTIAAQYGGTLSVVGDQTSGGASLTITGRGVNPS